MKLNLFDLTRASEITAHKEFLIFDVGWRFSLFAALLFAVFSLGFGLTAKVAVAAFLIALVVMLAAELLGPTRRLYPVRKWQQLMARVILVVFVVFAGVAFAGYLISVNSVGSGEYLFFFWLVSVFILATTAHSFRKPLDTKDGGKNVAL